MKVPKSESRIKSLRVQVGFSQEELANKTQLSLRTIQRIENGETVPRGDSLQRISKALNFKIADLSNPILKEEKGILLLLYISALAFLIFPLLGVIFPLILWQLFKDKINHVETEGKGILKAQIYWISVLFIVYLYIFCSKIFHFTLGLPANFNYKAVIIGLYMYNLIIVLFSIIQIVTGIIKRIISQPLFFRKVFGGIGK